MDYFLSLRESRYLYQSLIQYGILLQNNESNLIKLFDTSSVDYLRLFEGYVLPPHINNVVRKNSDITILKNGNIVLEKKQNLKDMQILEFDDILDMYIPQEQEKLNEIIKFWEDREKIYIVNTEEISITQKTNSIAGLASGHALARLAFETSATDITFFDYKESSLKFQRDLIISNDRIKVFKEYSRFLTFGERDANDKDIENLDFEYLNKIYNNLRNKNLKFLKIDLRKQDDIQNLIEQLPYNTVLWISNVFYYVTSINYYNLENQSYLDKLCKDKNITLLPFTRIYYES